MLGGKEHKLLSSLPSFLSVNICLFVGFEAVSVFVPDLELCRLGWPVSALPLEYWD